MERVPMTQDAYNRKHSEVDELENVVMPQIASAIAAAREEGDLKENAESVSYTHLTLPTICSV